VPTDKYESHRATQNDWQEMIGHEIVGVAEEHYALLFFADIMHDGTLSTHANLPAELLHKNNAPVFVLNVDRDSSRQYVGLKPDLRTNVYELGNKEGYRRFWAIYHKPPKAEYRDYLLERRDSLIPLDERSFKGAYYTPLAVVDKAYDKLWPRHWVKTGKGNISFGICAAAWAIWKSNTVIRAISTCPHWIKPTWT